MAQTAGTDRLTLTRDDDGFAVLTRAPAGSEPRPHVLAVGAYRREAGALKRVALSTVEVAGERTRVELPRDADLYLVNDEDLTFATTRPDADSRTALFEGAAELPTPISRAVAVATAWDMLMTGEAHAAEVVRCVASVLRAETSGSVVEPYLTLACDGALLWAPPADRPSLTAEISAIGRRLAEDPARRQVALRAVAGTAGDIEELAWLQDQAGDDVDLQWRVLVRRAEIGEVSADQVEALLSRDQDPDAWVRALTVRAATPAADDKAAVWRTLVVDRAVPIGAFGQVARAFWRPDQDELLEPYADRYLELLPGLHEGGMIPAMVLTVRLFPVFGIDADFLHRAEQSAGAAAPVVRKTMTERADEVRRMLVSRATSAPAW